jgi:hypothetical protein
MLTILCVTAQFAMIAIAISGRVWPFLRTRKPKAELN